MLSFIIAAIATPPDVVSQLALAVPMCLLYELGLWVARLIAPKSEENADAGESAERLPAQTRNEALPSCPGQIGASGLRQKQEQIQGL